MIKQVNILYLKEKFATLLSKLYEDAKISLNEINDKLLYSDFLNCFEQNQLDEFINDSYESIIYKLFNKETVFSNELNSEIYWAGIQYMNIFLNKTIPLKQILLLCPLEEMIEYFAIYHELQENEIINKFISDNYSKSILSKLIKDKTLNMQKISYLTNISINTLKYYSLNNINLFNASNENINKLKHILKVDDSLFVKQSNFVPYSSHLLEDQTLFYMFNEIVKKYYKTNENVKNKDGLLYITKRNRKIIIPDELIGFGIKSIIKNYTEDRLLF